MNFKFKIQQYQTDALENTVAVFAGQSLSATMSDKVAPTKEQHQDKWREGQDGRMDADFNKDVDGPKLKRGRHFKYVPRIMTDIRTTVCQVL